MTISSLASGRVAHHGKYNSREGNKITRVIVHHWAGVIGGDTRLLNPDVAVSANYILYNDGRLVLQVPEQFRAWTTGGFNYDKNSITVEVQNSSVGGDWPTTQAAVDKLQALIADIAKRYGWGGVSGGNVRGHREFVATACPGEFLWSRMAQLVATANAIYSGSSKPATPTPSNPVVTGSATELAYAVIRGEYGNGDARKAALGSRYDEIQAIVNQLLGVKNPIPNKTTEQLAREVLAGKWGNGADRVKRLGTRYNEVQAKVNELLGESKPKPVTAVDLTRLANAVIRGDYGNGDARKAALGANYDAVQEIVNQMLGINTGRAPVAKNLDRIAAEVRLGDWGNGADRVARLKKAGYDPVAVQRRVNELYYS